MKNLICFIFLITLFGCEKFEDKEFSISYPNFSHKNFKSQKDLALQKRNNFLLDSLLTTICYFGPTIDITCQSEDFFEKAKIDNKEQKLALVHWKACLDSLKSIGVPYEYLHYFEIALKTKPITQKELRKRLKIANERKNKNLDLRIYFSTEDRMDCFGAYFDSMNLIVIYDYLDTTMYGNQSEYLAKGLLFFHELFHADPMSRNSFNVNEQHILINFYENVLTDFVLNIDEYAEDFLESSSYKIELFTEINFAKNGNLIFKNVNNIVEAKKAIEAEKMKMNLNVAINSLKEINKSLSKR